MQLRLIVGTITKRQTSKMSKKKVKRLYLAFGFCFLIGRHDLVAFWFRQHSEMFCLDQSEFKSGSTKSRTKKEQKQNQTGQRITNKSKIIQTTLFPQQMGSDVLVAYLTRNCQSDGIMPCSWCYFIPIQSKNPIFQQRTDGPTDGRIDGPTVITS